MDRPLRILKKILVCLSIGLVSLVVVVLAASEMAFRYYLPNDLPSLHVRSEESFAGNVMWVSLGIPGNGDEHFLWLGNLLSRGTSPGAHGAARSWTFSSHRGIFRERHIKRAFAEIAAAVWLSRHASTAELKQLLMDTSNFGGGCMGFGNAAQAYFGKTTAELTVGEVAVIAEIPLAPSKFNPATHPREAEPRRNYLLRRMREENLISEPQMASALLEPISVLGPGRCASPPQ